MELESLDAALVIDIFLLLLTGIGPKIALVPFLEATQEMPGKGRKPFAVSALAVLVPSWTSRSPTTPRRPASPAVLPGVQRRRRLITGGSPTG